MPSAFVELNEPGNRAHVHFHYSPEAVKKIKAVPGARFVPKDKGGPLWQLPLDLVSMRRLREVFGTELQVGDAIRVWGKEQVAKEQKLRTLSVLDDVPLEELDIATKLPELAKWLRPYQRADVKFLATTSALNLNEPRLGKTVEIIASIYEAGLEHGPHLIVAPATSLDTVWRMEIERWTETKVFTYSGQSKDNVEEFYECLDGPCWWVTTADMVRKGSFPQIPEWQSFTIDEFHKTGLAEIKNVFPKRATVIKAKRKFAMSGTPMGGKPIKLWGALHFLEPDQYTSKWRWAGQWLEVTEVWGGHKQIGGIRKGREDEFYQMLAPHTVRRLRKEVLPQLPEKQWVDVWCEMTTKQAKQYTTFARDAEIRIDEYHLSATSILAEYTRLKQFSNSYCEVEVLGVDEDTGQVNMKVKATPESGKLPYLLERLAEVGIDPEDPEGTSQAIVTSQFRETAEMVYSFLTEKGIKCALITGKVNKKERDRIQGLFKAGHDGEGYRVVVMTTTAGGVAITLDNVETVHVLDETWNPDDQDQVTDRAINTTRLHQVTAFVYRSRKTIEEYIQEVTDTKFDLNRDILDLRRQGFRASVQKG
jgi:SNF2 family DNA or RNA helicase